MHRAENSVDGIAALGSGLNGPKARLQCRQKFVGFDEENLFQVGEPYHFPLTLP